MIGAGGRAESASRPRRAATWKRLFGGKVFLDVWVKVKAGWADDERSCRLGY